MPNHELNVSAEKAEAVDEPPTTLGTRAADEQTRTAKPSIGSGIASVTTLLAAFGAICFVSFSKRVLDDNLENTLARFAWDARDFLFVSAFLAASVSLVLCKGKKTRLGTRHGRLWLHLR